MIFYMITLAGVLCLYVVILNTEMDHTPSAGGLFACGPFASFTAASDYLFDYLDDFVVYVRR